MPHLTRKNTPTDFQLSGRQLFELDFGPKPGGSAFADEAELREAWAANRDKTLQRYAFTLHDAGWRPEAFWYRDAGTEAGGYDHNAPNGNSTERLRWLFDHDAFLPVSSRSCDHEPTATRAATPRRPGA